MPYQPGEKPTGAQLHALQQLILSREKDNAIAGAWMTLAAIAPHQAFARALRDLILLKDAAFAEQNGGPVTVPAATLTVVTPGHETKQYDVSGHGATPIRKDAP